MIHEKVTATVVEKEFVKFHAFDQIAQSLGFERRYMRVADFPVPRPRRKHKQKKRRQNIRRNIGQNKTSEVHVRVSLVVAAADGLQ